jgi:NSS family neurotransmitter:Na+ symporter
MPGGQLIGIAFFVLLAIAALTSTVSLLEVPVAFLVDEKKWSRKKSVIVIAVATFLLGLPSALSQGTSELLSSVRFLGQTGFLDIMSFMFSDLSLPIGGFFIALFVGWVWGVKQAHEEVVLNTSARTFSLMRGWGVLVRYVCPTLIFVVLLFKVIG